MIYIFLLSKLPLDFKMVVDDDDEEEDDDDDDYYFYITPCFNYPNTLISWNS